jgi:uncharacterized protein
MVGRFRIWRRSRPPVGFVLVPPQPEAALITGASSGIGAAFARQLATLGYDLFLVARRADRLAALADELVRSYRIRASVLVADLANPNDAIRVAEHTAAIHNLAFLINNAGFGTVGAFADIALDQHLAMLAVHVTAGMRLCYAALPVMRQRQRGAIVNVSSVAAFTPVDGNTTYAATKAHLNVFTQALAAEVQGTGICCQALCPGYTYTELHNTPAFATFSRYSAAPPLFWMTAESVVSASLTALERGPVIFIPGLHNRLLVAAAERKPGARLLWLIVWRLSHCLFRISGSRGY